MRKKLPIPDFKSIQEEAEFWDSHDSEDYLWGPPVMVEGSKKVVSVYTKDAIEYLKKKGKLPKNYHSSTAIPHKIK